MINHGDLAKSIVDQNHNATWSGSIYALKDLLMFVNNEIKEHRIQDSMGLCLRGKRTAERQYSEGVKYQCIKSKAELEFNIDG